MKKYFILTSILALTACGGGSGGGGSHVTPSSGRPSVNNDITVPEELAGRVTATTSNSAITGMNSEVIVSDHSNVALARTPHTITNQDGVTFTSYRLEDIKLYAADSSHTDNGYLQIGMNEETGRIENMKLVVGGVGAPADRVSETNQFRAPILEFVRDEYKGSVSAAGISGLDDPALEAERASHNWSTKGYWVLDGEDYKYYKLGDQAVYRTVETANMTFENLQNLNLVGGHWNRIDEVMNVETYGKDIGNNKKLQYSDFGHFNPVYATKDVRITGGDATHGWNAVENKNETAKLNEKLAKEDYQLFAGGYAIQGTTLQDSLDRPTNAVYKGMAIGRVYTSISGDNNDARESHFEEYHITGDGHDIAKAFTTKKATMTIENGKQTLYMPFNTYSDDEESKFYDVTLVKNADGTIENPVFTGTPTNAEHGLHDALEHVQETTFNPGYYGVNTATEAAGTARLYSEKDLGGGVKREYEVQAAYGMLKQ